jgi:hypothetical protein
VVVLVDHGWANRIWNHGIHEREAGVRDRFMKLKSTLMPPQNHELLSPSQRLKRLEEIHLILLRVIKISIFCQALLLKLLRNWW